MHQHPIDTRHDYRHVRHGRHAYEPGQQGSIRCRHSGSLTLSIRHKSQLYGLVAGLALIVSLAVNLYQHAENSRLRREVVALEISLSARAPERAILATKAPAKPEGGARAVESAPVIQTMPDTATVGIQTLNPDAEWRLRRFTAAELASLTNAIALFPNGIRTVHDEAGKIVQEVDPLTANLIQGFHLLDSGQKADAATVFESILKFLPNWPYGFFYLALATGSRNHMELAAERFQALEDMSVATPETELYHVLAALFLNRSDVAERWLAAHDNKKLLAKMRVGPLYIPESVSATIRRGIEGIEGVPLLHATVGVK